MTTRPTADRTDEDVATILASYEAFAKGDIDAAVEMLDRDVVWNEPDEFPNGGPRKGRDSVAEYLRASRAMWTELESEATPYRHEDDIVIVHHVRGRMADGGMHEATVADVFTVRNGVVVRMQAFADPEAAFERRSDVST
jgi:ketosteroid isomerase-like protein